MTYKPSDTLIDRAVDHAIAVGRENKRKDRARKTILQQFQAKDGQDLLQKMQAARDKEAAALERQKRHAIATMKKKGVSDKKVRAALEDVQRFHAIKGGQHRTRKGQRQALAAHADAKSIRDKMDEQGIKLKDRALGAMDLTAEDHE